MTEDDEPDKSLFEVMFAAGEEARKQPPQALPEPTKPFDPKALEEAYAKVVPPRQYRPASEFVTESDPDARADALYQACLAGDIDLLCSDIRALIDELKGTFSGSLLHVLANPTGGANRTRTQGRKRLRRKPVRLSSLFSDD